MNNRLAWPWLAIPFVSFAIGCGSNRIGIEGIVTCDGQPLEQGYISFHPHSTTGGPTVGAAIEGGAFRIAPEQGVLPGGFEVVITASRKSGQQIPDDFSGGMADVFQQYLPERYNSRTELSATINDTGTHTLSFELTTD